LRQVSIHADEYRPDNDERDQFAYWARAKEYIRRPPKNRQVNRRDRRRHPQGVKPQAYAPSIVRPISHRSAHRAKCGGKQLDHEDLDHELSSSIGGGRPRLCRRREMLSVD
jgi:hypothetical protein